MARLSAGTLGESVVYAVRLVNEVAGGLMAQCSRQRLEWLAHRADTLQKRAETAPAEASTALEQNRLRRRLEAEAAELRRQAADPTISARYEPRQLSYIYCGSISTAQVDFKFQEAARRDLRHETQEFCLELTSQQFLAEDSAAAER